MIQIPKWQFKHIQNALRLSHRINGCAGKETAFDREVVKALDFATTALEQDTIDHAVYVVGFACGVGSQAIRQVIERIQNQKMPQLNGAHADTFVFDDFKKEAKSASKVFSELSEAVQTSKQKEAQQPKAYTSKYAKRLIRKSKW